ncbi:MAG TPA: MFS transporter [Nocardioides sp.]|nr:MFS transporter [Nocardioides sp.]
MLAVLRRRDFSLLWLSGLVSVAGDWVLMIALPYYVYVTTGSTLATAGMTAAELAPAILLSSFTGVLADRWDRKRILVVANLLQALVVASLLLVGEGWLWVVYVVAALQSTAAAFSQPAEAALLPTLVPVEQLVQANALNTLNNRLGRFVGVPVGAALLSWWGLDAVVVVDAVTFLVAAALLAPISAPVRVADPDDEPEEPHFWREWTAGLRVVRRDRTIAVLFVVFGLMTFGGTMLDPLYVPWIRDVLDEGVEVVAVVTMTHSVAGIVGSLLVGTWGSRFSARTLMGWGSVIAGVLLLVKFNVPVLWLTLALSAIGGATAVASSVGVETLAQERTPEHVRGRVFGSLQAFIWLASLLGAVVGGVLGELTSVLVAINVAAGLVTGAGVVVLLAIPAARERPAPRGRTPARGRRRRAASRR